MGLTAEQAVKAVGTSRAALHRWEKETKQKSRRPHKLRRATWTPELAEKRLPDRTKKQAHEASERLA